jgi:ribonuclease R
LTGERTGKVYRFGDTVQVSVAAANVERLQIDLELVEGEGGTRDRQKGRGGDQNRRSGRSTQSPDRRGGRKKEAATPSKGAAPATIAKKDTDSSAPRPTRKKKTVTPQASGKKETVVKRGGVGKGAAKKRKRKERRG